MPSSAAAPASVGCRARTAPRTCSRSKPFTRARSGACPNTLAGRPHSSGPRDRRSNWMTLSSSVKFSGPNYGSCMLHAAIERPSKINAMKQRPAALSRLFDALISGVHRSRCARIFVGLNLTAAGRFGIERVLIARSISNNKRARKDTAAPPTAAEKKMIHILAPKLALLELVIPATARIQAAVDLHEIARMEEVDGSQNQDPASHNQKAIAGHQRPNGLKAEQTWRHGRLRSPRRPVPFATRSSSHCHKAGIIETVRAWLARPQAPAPSPILRVSRLCPFVGHRPVGSIGRQTLRV
jgi:hypothetical protein